MALYKVVATVQDTRISAVQKKAREVFGIDFSVEKVKADQTRADRLEDANCLIEEAKGVVEELKEELQEWLDNLPENLSESSKADELQEAIDALEEGEEKLEDAASDLGEVTFPGMMG